MDKAVEPQNIPDNRSFIMAQRLEKLRERSDYTYDVLLGLVLIGMVEEELYFTHRTYESLVEGLPFKSRMLRYYKKEPMKMPFGKLLALIGAVTDDKKAFLAEALRQVEMIMKCDGKK